MNERYLRMRDISLSDALMQFHAVQFTWSTQVSDRTQHNWPVVSQLSSKETLIRGSNLQVIQCMDLRIFDIIQSFCCKNLDFLGFP